MGEENYFFLKEFIYVEGLRGDLRNLYFIGLIRGDFLESGDGWGCYFMLFISFFLKFFFRFCGLIEGE